MNTKGTSVAEAYPHLVGEWNFERNNGLTPWDVTPGMHRKVWWKCSEHPEHEWEAYIFNRARVKNPRGCPHCSNQVLNSKNNLAFANPELAKEWCYELNGTLTPELVQAGGKDVVWWQCPRCSHQWEAQIYQRNKGHYKCIRCTSLAYNYPELLEDWDYERNKEIDPWIVGSGSHRKAWWKCSKCGYQWESEIIERTKGHKTCTGCRSIAVTHPDVAKDWHATLNERLTPCDVTFGSNRYVWWTCSRNPQHVIRMMVQERCNDGCSICAKGRNTSINEAALYLALKEVFPDAIHRHKINSEKTLEADIWIPTLSTAVEYDSYYYHRSEQKRKIDEQKNKQFYSLGIHLIRIREYPLQAIEPYGSDTIMLQDWRSSLNECYHQLISVLKVGYKTEPSILALEELAEKVEIDTMRFAAANYLASVPENESFAYHNPALIKEWHPIKNGRLTPWDVRPFANIKVWWHCSNNPEHEWQALVAKRANGRKCPHCYGTGSAVIVSSENSLENRFPKIAAQWHPTLNGRVTPDMIYMYSTKSAWWQCPRNPNHIWYAPVAKRTRLGRGCHYCTRQKILEEDSLAVLRPDLLAEWDWELNRAVNPVSVSLGSNRKIHWRCKCGGRWTAAVSLRVKGFGCCPDCRVLRKKAKK